jgi:response regulator RpfG family c-di-GMP phosphodiesterase
MLDASLKNARLLIVDDQEANLLVLEGMLEREGYTALKSLTDSRQVLAAFDEFQPDLILLDLHMPHLDGFAVMRQLKGRLPPDEYLPILVLTADVTPGVKLRALADGARDFLTKPLDVAETTLRVRNLLETRYLHQQQQQQNQILETKVRERTAELERQFQRLAALREIDTAITASLDLRLTLTIFLQQVTMQLRADAAAVLLLNPHSHSLSYAAGQGFHGRGIERTQQRLGEGYAGRAALERRLVHIPVLAEADDFRRRFLFVDERFVAYYGVPLIAKGDVNGVLEIFHRAPLDSGSDWLNFLEALAGQAAIAINNAQLFDSLQRSNLELVLAYDATIEGWSRAMDLRDRETEGHTQRVTDMTLKLAQLAGMNTSELVHVKRGALLHDMGKLGVPDAILLKPGKLTDEEWVIMKKHPQYAYEMLSPIPYLRPALDIPYCHHEKWDGSGYPRGLKGEQIPLPARLFAVADVWDALRSDRPYRLGWPEEKVLEHIRAGSGAHFDPQAVELFFQVINDRARESA